MSAIRLRLSPLARQDLVSIRQYSYRHWGNVIAADYMAHLKEQIWSLTRHPELGVARDELRGEMRSLRVKRHILYYLTRGHCIEIVRILGTRQDPFLHIEST